MGIKKKYFLILTMENIVMLLFIFFVANIYLLKSFVYKHVDPAEGALEELQRIIKLIYLGWGKVKIVVRGDSAYSILRYNELV